MWLVSGGQEKTGDQEKRLTCHKSRVKVSTPAYGSISFLVGHKKPIWLEIISAIASKILETEGTKHRKALKIMDFRKYLNWSYTPTRPGLFRPGLFFIGQQTSRRPCGESCRRGQGILQIVLQPPVEWRPSGKGDARGAAAPRQLYITIPLPPYCAPDQTPRPPHPHPYASSFRRSSVGVWKRSVAVSSPFRRRVGCQRPLV